MPNPIQGPRGKFPIDPNIGKEQSRSNETVNLPLSETGGDPVTRKDIQDHCKKLKSLGALPDQLRPIVDAAEENGNLPIGPLLISARNSAAVVAAIIATTSKKD